jgi:hypothetical protein
MSIRTLFLIPTIILLMSCGLTNDKVVDRCERNVRFDSCLSISAAARPSGAESEWDDVVERCDMVASQQSRKPVNVISKECQ